MLLQAVLAGTWHDIFLLEKDKNCTLWTVRMFRMYGQVRMFWMQGKMRDQLMRFALPTAPPANGNILIPQSICRIHKELRPLLPQIPYLYVCGSALVVLAQDYQHLFLTPE